MDFPTNPLLDHVDGMTDSPGLIQHAISSVPLAVRAAPR